MFGFINIDADQLADDRRQRYQQVYCGLCHALGEKTGQHTRLALNNDLTFVSLLLMSLYEPDERLSATGCVMHPVRKRGWSANPCIDYGADMTVALMYHKCQDDWYDDHSHLAHGYARMLQQGYERIEERWPRQCRVMEQALADITRMEESGVDDPDMCANRFGDIMAEVLAYRQDEWEGQMRAMGYALGQFIYMMDAAADLPEDMKKGSYNPLAARGFSEEDLRVVLAGYLGRVTDVFERLPLVQDVDLLRNVLYAGIWGRYNAMLKDQERELVGLPTDVTDPCEAADGEPGDEADGEPEHAASDEAGIAVDEEGENGCCQQGAADTIANGRA